MSKRRNEYTGKDGLTHYILNFEEHGRECPECQTARVNVKERRERKIVSLNSDGEKIILDVLISRNRCLECGKTWIPEYPYRGRKYSKIFTDEVVRRIVDDGETNGSVAEHFGISKASVQKILADYFEEQRGRQKYLLQERMLLYGVEIKSTRYFLLIGLDVFSLLDILREEQLPELKGRETVKEILVPGGREVKLAKELFENAKIYLSRNDLYSQCLEALLEEAQKFGLGKKKLRKYFAYGGEDVLTDLIKESVKVMPVILAEEFLRENIDDIDTLKGYSGELEGFKAFLQNLKPPELPPILDGMRAQPEKFEKRKIRTQRHPRA